MDQVKFKERNLANAEKMKLDLKKQNDTMEVKYNSISKALETSRAAQKSQEQEVKQLNDKLEVYKKQTLTLEKQLQTMSKELEDLRQEKKGLMKTLDQTELVTCKKSTSQMLMMENYKKLMDQLDELTKQNTQLQAEYEDILKQLVIPIFYVVLFKFISQFIFFIHLLLF